MSSLFWKNKVIVITGGTNFIGQHLVKLLTTTRDVKKRSIFIPPPKKYDLRDVKVAKKNIRGADIVIHLAGNSAGVNYSNTYPATQFRDCMLMDLAIFEAAAAAKVEKLIAISAAVAYPVDASSPLKEKDIFNGVPGNTGYGFGFVKRDTIVLARAYRQEKGLNAVVVIPSNAYGPGQSIDVESGHVVPSLIYKCLTQKKLVVWGDGNPQRDYLYVEDFAEGILLAGEKLETSEPVNLGSGQGVSVKQLVNEITSITKFKGKIVYDTTKPNGVAKKLVDISRAKRQLGFTPQWELHDGLVKTVEWIKQHI